MIYFQIFVSGRDLFYSLSSSNISFYYLGAWTPPFKSRHNNDQSRGLNYMFVCLLYSRLLIAHIIRTWAMSKCVCQVEIPFASDRFNAHPLSFGSIPEIHHHVQEGLTDDDSGRERLQMDSHALQHRRIRLATTPPHTLCPWIMIFINSARPLKYIYY